MKADEKSSFRVRCPIGLRSESDWIAFGVRLDCVRWRWGKVEISGAKIVSFIFELSHRKTSIHYPLALSLWDSSEQ